MKLKLNETAVIDASQADFSDFDNGWIKNVKICGFTSKNGRTYLPKAFQEGVQKYDQSAVYVNHPPKGVVSRVAEDRFGTLVKPRYVEGEGPRADLKFLTTHPMAPRIREDVEKSGGYFGLSHIIEGECSRSKDGVVVESIDKVIEVDIVTNPATVQSLREQDETVDAPDSFEMAVMGLLEENLSKDDLLAKIGELWDTLRGDSEGGSEGDSGADQPQEEATLRDQVNSLQEQVKQLQKAKYVKPRSGATTPMKVQESTIPSDTKELAAWLRD